MFVWGRWEALGRTGLESSDQQRRHLRSSCQQQPPAQWQGPSVGVGSGLGIHSVSLKVANRCEQGPLSEDEYGAMIGWDRLVVLC